MGPDDLGRLKHVGASRRKLLRDHGIETIGQLHATPEETLARIRTIGKHYAKLLKESAAGSVRSGEGRDTREIHREFRKKMKRLKTGLARVNEDFKPLGKQKYLELYVDLKKHSRALRVQIREMARVRDTLPDKVRKKILREAANLILVLKNAGEKPKKKKFRKITRKIQSLSETLRKVAP